MRRNVPHLADRRRQLRVVDGRGKRHGQAAAHLLEHGLAFDIGACRTLPGAADPAQPLAHIQMKRIPPLLAVIADVDSGGKLLADHVAHAGGGERTELTRVHRLAAVAPLVASHEVR